MASVAIIFRKDKLNKKGLAPIHFRIIKHRKVRYISSGIMIEPKYWSEKKSKVKPSYKGSQRLNSFLSHKFTELQDQVFALETNHLSLSSAQLKDKIMGRAPLDFLTFADEVIKGYLAADQIGTHDKNFSVIKKLRTYLNGKSLNFQDISIRFLTRYEQYLRDELGNATGTVQNSMKFFRKLFNEAIRQELIDPSCTPFNKYKIKNHKSQRVYLTEKELLLIEELNLERGSKIELHRDMFVFSAYVGGLRISDVLQLQSKHFDGTHIHTDIKKTGAQLIIKIPSKAIAIINKYRKNSEGFLFPVLDPRLLFIDDNPRLLDSKIASANAIINKSLKAIAKLAGLSKHISFHVSRHTWATRALTKGISIDKVSKLMGHANIRETQIYARIVGKALDDAMDAFED